MEGGSDALQLMNLLAFCTRTCALPKNWLSPRAHRLHTSDARATPAHLHHSEPVAVEGASARTYSKYIPYLSHIPGTVSALSVLMNTEIS